MAGEQPPRVAAPADSSSLIGICIIDQLGLLEALFGQIFVAPAVWEEVVLGGEGRPGQHQIANAQFIVRRQVQNQATVAMLQVFLGAGEAQTLALAQELSFPLVLIDEIKARKAAQQAGIRPMGVVGVLLAAKRRGLLV